MLNPKINSLIVDILLFGLTAILVLAFRSIIADIRRSLLYVLTIGFLLMIVSAPIAIANGYAENLYNIVPKCKQERFLIVNVSAKSLSDSILEYSIREQLVAMGFKEFFPHILLYSQVLFDDVSFDVRIRGVDRLNEYFNRNGFRVNGGVPLSNSEVAIGVLIARRFNIEKGTFLKIPSSDGSLKEFKVSGIIDCKCPSDEEVLMPLPGVWDIRPDNFNKVSFVEVIDSREIDPDMLHPLGVKILYAKPFHQAAYDIILKTFNSIRNWSAPVYLLILIAVYFIAVKMAMESEVEIAILRCIGASRLKAFAYLFYKCLIIAVLGIIVGLALGIVLAQIAFRLLSIILSTGTYIPPSLYVSDVVWIVSISLLSSISGILYPAIREVRKSLGDLTWRLTYQ